MLVLDINFYTILNSTAIFVSNNVISVNIREWNLKSYKCKYGDC
jgi:hypothetical protein